jgi:ubiquinone/menaquinone biosynthesis C-methylase UbiE
MNGKDQKALVRRQKWALCLALACTLPAAAQVATEVNERYQTPDGRQAVAQNLAGPDRDQRQKPGQFVRAMDLKMGMTVADVGTGIGYMLPFLSRAVGPAGKVVAEDIFDDFLAAARERAINQNLANITFIKGTDKDPMLPEGALDRVLVLDAYHHFDYPELMLAAIYKALKPDGRLVIGEYYKRPGAMPNGQAESHIRLDMPDLIKEVEANHFHLVSERETIKDSQYMLVLEKN